MVDQEQAYGFAEAVEQARQQALSQSLAIANNVVPTSPEMAEVGHKIALLQSKNPRAIFNVIQTSDFTPVMKVLYGSIALEFEAPERKTAVFNHKDCEKELLYLQLRLLDNRVLGCDNMDVRNPLFEPMLDGIMGQARFEITNCDKDVYTPTRDYQYNNRITSSVNTTFEERKREASSNGLINKIIGRRR